MAFLTPALSALRDEVDARWPNRSTVSDGWIGDPAHASRDSDHNPEPDGSVDAIDITHDPANGPDCNALADQVKDDPRLPGGGYVIWNWRIWNPDIAKIWRPYTGTNGHTKHMHVSVADRLQNNTSPWLTDKEELTVADIEALQKTIRNQHRKDRKLAVRLAVREGRIEKAVGDQIVDAIEADDED